MTSFGFAQQHRRLSLPQLVLFVLARSYRLNISRRRVWLTFTSRPGGARTKHTQGENARRASTCTGWTRGALSQPELLAPLPPFRRAAWITAVREEYGAAHVKLRSGEMQTAQTHDILRACSSAVRLLGVDYEQMHCCRKYMMHRSLVQAQCSMGLLIRVLRPQIMK